MSAVDDYVQHVHRAENRRLNVAFVGGSGRSIWAAGAFPAI
jgi:hypothetical protein